VTINLVHMTLTSLSVFCCPICEKRGVWDYDEADVLRCHECNDAWKPWDIVQYRGGYRGFTPGCPYEVAESFLPPHTPRPIVAKPSLIEAMTR